MNDADPTTTTPTAASPSLPPVPADEEVSELARHGDPSQARKTAEKQAPEAVEKARRGVVWVRPSELMTQASSRVAGRGIDFHAELVRRGRHPAVQAVAASRKAISERASRLPPVSAFGRRGQSPSGATRSGIGLS